jgi:hypothetical protein
MLLNLKSNIHSDSHILLPLNNASLSIRKGLATITIHKNPTLTIKTRASAINGKNNHIATAVLNSSSPTVFHMLAFMLVSAKVAKSIREIYIVANGPTCHLLRLIISDNFVA